LSGKILLLIVTILLRVSGAATRTDNWQWSIRIVGWMLCLMTAWIAVSAIGAWPLLWPVPVIGLVYLLIEFRLNSRPIQHIFWIIADFIAVILFGFLSLSSLKLLLLITTAIAVALGGFALDWLLARLSKQIRLAILALLPVICIIGGMLKPTTTISGLYLLKDRLFHSESLSVTLNSREPFKGELSFTDITLSAGTGGPTGEGETGGHGVMFADVDNEGRPDLYITMIWDQPMADLFFHNNDGRVFANEGVLRGIDDYDGGSHGACFADLDNDGDYDLFNGTTSNTANHPAINNVFRNDGRGHFVEVTASSGLPLERQWPTRAVLCFDMDSDGDLDIFGVTNFKGTDDPADEHNEIYRNDGDFQFTTINTGDLYNAPAGQGATDTDYDADGDIDVIAANRTGDVNILRNDGTSNFSLISPTSIGLRHKAGDGISTADVNNDGYLDMLLASDNKGHLYLNNGNGTFTFKKSFFNTDGYMGGFADLDNDGDGDLVFAGDRNIYLNDGTGNFSPGPVVPISGIDDPRGISFADIDGDGDLDFAIGVKRARNWLVRNNFNSGNWLKVQLISPQGQAGAMGAKTFIYPSGQAGGTLLGVRESRSNTGYLGQNDPVLHFGLGSHRSVDVVVQFLDGSTVTQTNVSAGQTILFDGTSDESLDRIGMQWSPYIEWGLENSSFVDNPYDLMATVTFMHKDSGETRTTEMFYDGDHIWKFRFTGTLSGTWTFTTASNDADLNGHRGRVIIHANPGIPGFITHFDNKWAWSGTNKAFIPQLVMYSGPQGYFNNPAQIDADIQTFIVDHGFNGFHTMVFCYWFDINQQKCNSIRNPDPDPRTFEALELLITKTHANGGMVHIWMWGDEQRDQTIKGNWGGIDGPEDRRLQRYIAARLGPLPGWTMGYGFDLDEWVSERQIHQWHDNMHSYLGWSHFLSGRPEGPNSGTNHSPWISWNQGLDYSSYEHHKPNYEVYVAAIDAVSGQPIMSEDRFRIRSEGRSKDYTMEETRRGLWHSVMAGGVANIWGNLIGASGANDGSDTSAPYPKPEWIKTYALFFESRFTGHEIRCNNLTDGFCLKHSDKAHFIFYKEDAALIQIDLSSMHSSQQAIAVDTKQPYKEIELGTLTPTNQTWTAPYISDWVIAVGNFL
jgi:hypothetical protein